MQSRSDAIVVPQHFLSTATVFVCLVSMATATHKYQRGRREGGEKESTKKEKMRTGQSKSSGSI